jgi:hypothetical protein
MQTHMTIASIPTELAGEMARVEQQIEAYLQRYSPSSSRPRVVVLTDLTWTYPDWRAYRKQTRCYEGVGVYLHYSGNGELLYIGKAESTFDRCWANDTAERRWIIGLEVSDATMLSIPRLERFLIEELNPKNNILYNKRR